MNWLLEQLPDKVIINGAEYPINSDFRAIILIIIGFSLLNCLEFFVFRKMKSSSTINHPLCGCESNVIQKKLPFRVQ